jgi:hypothetical protein
VENRKMPKYLISYKLSPSKQSDDPKVAYEAMKTAMARADELLTVLVTVSGQGY